MAKKGLEHTYWAGVVDGNIFWQHHDDPHGNAKMPSLFLHEEDARHRFNDVVKVVVTRSPVNPRRKPKP